MNPSTPKPNRVLCLIDSQNLYYTALKTFNGGKVDYQKLRDLIVSSLANNGKTPSDPVFIVFLVADPLTNIKGFLNVLRRLGFETRLKLIFFEGEKTQNTDWDEGIIKEALRMTDTYDELVIASGDGDFAPLAMHLREKGKKVSVACFHDSPDTSQILISAADSVIQLNPGVLM